MLSKAFAYNVILSCVWKLPSTSRFPVFTSALNTRDYGNTTDIMSMMTCSAPVNASTNDTLPYPFLPQHQPFSKINYEMPAVYHDAKNRIRISKDDIQAYITHELTTPRLTPILENLWLAGRPMAARDLHRQIMMGRNIIRTEQADMHLIWTNNSIFIKPLPPMLLDHQTWTTHLNTNPELHSAALGFLLSYIWLINHPSDYDIAQDTGLLPKELTWAQWNDFCARIASYISIHGLDGIAPRYRYGELRLPRINWIYRLKPAFKLKHFVRGYCYMYHQYGSYFKRNFGWMLTLFAFFSIVLSGLQVGLGTDGLKDNNQFLGLAYWSTMLLLGLSGGLVALVGLLFIFFVLFNAIVTVLFHDSQKRLRAKGVLGTANGIA